ncbi:MAG: hypothetical protein FWG98_08290 [Candidatus Cloacimonetes bacterium]|nr:hypothetical protein [Candidatus Cloacimonadota bacterium]
MDFKNGLEREQVNIKIPEMSARDFRNFIREATEYLYFRNQMFQKLAKERK